MSQLQSLYNNNLAATVNAMSAFVLGPVTTRFKQLESTPGVKADTIQSMKDLISSTTTTLANPTSISLTTLQNQYITIQSRYALLDNQARTEAAAYAADQAGSADLSGNTVTGVDISGGVAVSNNEFNIYSFAIRTTNIFVKYLWLILLIVFGLIGGSLMSNRAIGLSIAFRIYYLVYGSLLFPISYGLIIYQYFSSGMVDRPHFYALLAPLIPSDNMSLITKTIFFPFVYNTKSSGTKEGLARDNRLGISAPPPTPPLAKSPANNA